MTEEEWLAHKDPLPLLEFAASQMSDRRSRLYLCACCARMLEGFAHGRLVFRNQEWGLQQLWKTLETVEQFVDGLCGSMALESARGWALDAEYTPGYIDYGGETGLDREIQVVSEAAAAGLLSPRSVSFVCGQALAALERYRDDLDYQPPGAAPKKPLAEHERDMASWLRDVVGNPFRPAQVDPAWLLLGDGLVGKMAENIYASGSFHELAILADALEDAGCTNSDILEHCRGPGPHIRGCWVLDLFIEAPRRFARMAAAPEPREESRPAAAESPSGLTWNQACAIAREESLPAAAEPPPPAPPRPQLRPGDWICPGCQAHNFARRDTCLRCQRSRPRPQLREGDWLCPACNAHNFARRQTCHQCKGARPS